MVLPTDRLRALLDGLYGQYNRVSRIAPDPLQCVRCYPDPSDREIAALVASSLAFGRVRSIVCSVQGVLEIMGPHPACWLQETSRARMVRTLADFRHRWVTGAHLAALLWSARMIRLRHGSMGQFVRLHRDADHPTLMPALLALARELGTASSAHCGFLVANPQGVCAHKRLNLMARWLVRVDDVDPGGWRGLSPAHLVVPLDVHMHRVGTRLGFTHRPRPDLRAAREVTSGFASIRPEDPVRYDFSLTRASMDGALPPWLDGHGSRTASPDDTFSSQGG